jgi:hypothetical protein
MTFDKCTHLSTLYICNIASNYVYSTLESLPPITNIYILEETNNSSDTRTYLKHYYPDANYYSDRPLNTYATIKFNSYPVEDPVSGIFVTSSISLLTDIEYINNNFVYTFEMINNNPISNIFYTDFSNNPKLISVKLYDGIIHISNDAFQNCDALSSISISNSVKTIGNNVFYNCTSLTSIMISSNILILGNGIGTSVDDPSSTLMNSLITDTNKLVGNVYISTYITAYYIYLYNP